MFDLFWDLYQEREISDARSRAVSAGHRADEANMAASSVQARVDRLTLLNMALWSLVKETTGLTDEQLAERVQQIDMQDGRVDGRVRSAPEACSQCGRTLSRKHLKCLFCGHQPTGGDMFGSVAR